MLVATGLVVMLGIGVFYFISNQEQETNLSEVDDEGIVMGQCEQGSPDCEDTETLTPLAPSGLTPPPEEPVIEPVDELSTEYERGDLVVLGQPIDGNEDDYYEYWSKRYSDTGLNCIETEKALNDVIEESCERDNLKRLLDVAPGRVLNENMVDACTGSTGSDSPYNRFFDNLKNTCGQESYDILQELLNEELVNKVDNLDLESKISLQCSGAQFIHINKDNTFFIPESNSISVGLFAPFGFDSAYVRQFELDEIQIWFNLGETSQWVERWRDNYPQENGDIKVKIFDVPEQVINKSSFSIDAYPVIIIDGNTHRCKYSISLDI